jgi:hypothetical protein
LGAFITGGLSRLLTYTAFGVFVIDHAFGTEEVRIGFIVAGAGFFVKAS